MKKSRVIVILCACAICVGIGIRTVGRFIGGGYETSENARKEMQELIFGSEELTDDEVAVDRIREYIYEQMEWAFAEDFHTDVVNQIFSDDLSWEERIYELCEPDTIESPGYCGGTAYVLAVVYNMLGYESCTLDMAVFDENGNVVNSHVVTLVSVDGEWIVEDASYNLTFKKEGKHIPIQDLIRCACENDIDDIEIVYGDNKWRKGVLVKPEYEGEYTLLEPGEFIEFSDGYYVYVEMRMEDWISIDEMKEYFAESGYATNMLGLYGYPYDIYLTKNSLMNVLEQKLLITKLKSLAGANG